MWKNIDDGSEYRIGANGQWKGWQQIYKRSLTKLQDIIAYVRKAGATNYPYQAKQLLCFFIENLDFSRLKLNVAKGVIGKLLLIRWR